MYSQKLVCHTRHGIHVSPNFLLNIEVKDLKTVKKLMLTPMLLLKQSLVLHWYFCVCVCVCERVRERERERELFRYLMVELI